MKKTNFLAGMFTGVIVCLSILLVVGWLLFEQYEKSRLQPPQRSDAARRESIADYLPALTAPKTPADMLAALDKIIALRPGDAAARAAKGDLLAELGDYAGALRAYDEAIALEPSNAQLYFSRAIPKFMLGDYAGAAGDLGFAVSLNPQMAQAYYNRGVANMNMAQIMPASLDFARARDLFAGAGNIAGAGDAAAALRLADSYLASSKTTARGKRKGASANGAASQKPAQTLTIKRGDETAAKRREQLVSSINAAMKGPNGALEKFKANAAINRKGDMPAPADFAAYDAALRKTVADSRNKAPSAEPQNILEYMASAKKKSAAGDYKGAVADLSAAISSSPDQAHLYTERARALAADNDLPAALADINKALSLDGNNASSWLQKAQLESALGNNKAALEAAKKAKGIFDELRNPAGSQAAQNEINRQQGRARQAMKNDGQLEKLFTSATQAYEKGDYKAARDDFGRMIKLQPKEAGNYHNRGLTKMHLGDVKEAINDFTEALKRKPNDAGTMLARANALAEDGQFDAALMDIRNARKIAPDNEQLPTTEAMIKAKTGDIEGAITAAKAADSSAADALLGSLYASRLPLEDVSQSNVNNYISNFEASVRSFDSAIARMENDGAAPDRLKDLQKNRAQAAEILQQLRAFATQFNN
ncbi:MAG: tetratricopeptide repeat protein [Elusimicrobiota bacterium]|nr:tetratricopeptide repeat protein [Elusimicrobiota bacterium]